MNIRFSKWYYQILTKKGGLKHIIVFIAILVFIIASFVKLLITPNCEIKRDYQLLSNDFIGNNNEANTICFDPNKTGGG